jgi:hypothetical protein
MTLGATITDTQLCVGGNVNASIAFINQSTSPIQTVEFVIEQHVRWRAESHSSGSHYVIARQILNVSDVNNELLTKLSEDSDENTVLQGVFEQLSSSSATTVTLNCGDKRVVNSYNGSLITCSHRFTALLRTASCVTNPQVSCDLRFFSSMSAPQQGSTSLSASQQPIVVAVELPPEDRTENVQPPPNWNNVIVSDVIIIPMENVQFGGAANDSSAVVTAVRVSTRPSPTALPSLLKESINSVHAMNEISKDVNWSGVLSSLDPVSYANAVKACESYEQVLKKKKKKKLFSICIKNL